MSFPINAVRSQFPALGRRHLGNQAIYLDGPGGSQVVESAISLVAGYMRRGGANLHGAFPSSVETERIIDDARQAMADLLCADSPDEIAIGANATTLLFTVSHALAREWKPGDEIVLTELDHRANVDSWLTVAEEKGLTIRWIKVDTQTLTLDLSELDTLINEKTVLVAAGYASNAVGTINDIRTISARAHAVGAVMAVDAVHAVPHILTDVNALGADILACSSYKFFGPHIGFLYIRRPLFERLRPYKLAPQMTTPPWKIETGTFNHEGLAGVAAAVDFMAGLGKGATRRDKLASAYRVIEAYENALADKARAALARIPNVHIYQPAGPKTPTIGLRIKGVDPAEACKTACDTFGVFIASGDFYATTLATKLGIVESGGFVRAGIAPYNTEQEIDTFIRAIETIAR